MSESMFQQLEICQRQRDAALARETELKEELERQKRYVEINANSAHGKHKEGQRYRDERDALQLRLNAADQRVDDAIDLLRRSHAVVDGTGWTDLERDIVAFFKPAEAERNHEIPGTSGMRLNMLASQGE